jgi:uncharacterized protein YkwD
VRALVTKKDKSMSNANDLELEMLALINAERAEAGLNALRLNTALNDAAEDHSQWMLDADVFSHTGQSGSSAGDRMGDAGFAFEGAWSWAENIGWQSARGEPGFSDDVADIHAGLMNSPGHRANLLDPNLEEIGIGVEIGEFTTGGGDWEAVMITQNFATTDADTSAQADPGTGETVTPEDEPAPEPPMEDPETDDPDDVIGVVDEDVPDTPETDDEEPETPDDTDVAMQPPDEPGPLDDEPEPDACDMPLTFAADDFLFEDEDGTVTFDWDALWTQIDDMLNSGCDTAPASANENSMPEDTAMADADLWLWDCA